MVAEGRIPEQEFQRNVGLELCQAMLTRIWRTTKGFFFLNSRPREREGVTPALDF